MTKALATEQSRDSILAHEPQNAIEFVRHARILNSEPHLSAISLFSGGGLSDLGYEQAGFRFHVHVEKELHRAALCQRNFKHSEVITGDINEHATIARIIQSYKTSSQQELTLLTVTPPCQGMSSTNPERGSVSDYSDNIANARNSLLLSSIPIIHALHPKVVIAENVSNALLKQVIRTSNGEPEAGSLVDFFERDLPSYKVFRGVVQMADYGIAQERRRSVIVAIRRDQSWLKDFDDAFPWPSATHSEISVLGRAPWISLQEWLESLKYPVLDSNSKESAYSDSDLLHFVPSYENFPDRYRWIADIPPYSGQSAYLNECAKCKSDVAEKMAYCLKCGTQMRNRPFVEEKDGTFRLVKGYSTAYRRMWPDRPASTVTTASSHLGSNYTIHPWENRVLSVRECADLQTVPLFYDWSYAVSTRHNYICRQVIGEALPPWFTYLHGKMLRQYLLTDDSTTETISAVIPQELEVASNVV
jgi:DNA (cytosine-5)-methyltransferase 1